MTRQSSWVLEFPQTKPMSLNDRHHWRVKAERTAEYVNSTIVLVKQARIPKLDKISVLLAYRPRAANTRDPLNLVQTLKAIEDGVVRAGVVPDDTPAYVVSRMPVIWEPGPPNKLGGRLWVLVTDLGT